MDFSGRGVGIRLKMRFCRQKNRPSADDVLTVSSLAAGQGLAHHCNRIQIRWLRPRLRRDKRCINVETGPLWAGRSLADLRDQRRVMVTAAMTTIASMHAGTRKPIFISLVIAPIIGVFFTASQQIQLHRRCLVCQTFGPAPEPIYFLERIRRRFLPPIRIQEFFCRDQASLCVKCFERIARCWASRKPWGLPRSRGLKRLILSPLELRSHSP